MPRKFLRIAAALLAALVVALALLAAWASTRPDRFSVARALTVQAPPEAVFAQINDLRAFNTWNPFNRKDPSMRGSYRGPAAGPGAAYDFAGDGNVGAGTVRITDAAAPSRVAMKLDMTAPMEAHNDILFSLTPRGTATEVRWSMQGACPLPCRMMRVVFDFDRMIGGDFESGLRGLKARVETP
jgi:hypothetical protein